MSAAEQQAKVGLTTEQWAKFWEEGDFGCGEEECSGHHGHDHDQHHGHDHAHGHAHDGDDEYYDGHGSGKVDKYLQKHLARLTGGKPKAAFLITLCGNSPDLVWLCEQGYTVVGSEISEKAVKEIFEKPLNGTAVPYAVTSKGNFKVYSATDGKDLKVYVGDFLELTAEITGTFDAVWDSHGIVSLPITFHGAYAQKVCSLLKPGGKLLFSTVEYDINELQSGPAPCPIPTDRLKELFPDNFDVELLDNPKLQCGDFPGVTSLTNPIHLLTQKN